MNEAYIEIIPDKLQELRDEQKMMEIDDSINPDHYRQGNVETIEAIESALDDREFLGAMKANVLKYVWRCRLKETSSELQDLMKAEWYLKKAITKLREQ